MTTSSSEKEFIKSKPRVARTEELPTKKEGKKIYSEEFRSNWNTVGDIEGERVAPGEAVADGDRDTVGDIEGE
jgi:hypothetical protein